MLFDCSVGKRIKKLKNKGLQRRKKKGFERKRSGKNSKSIKCSKSLLLLKEKVVKQLQKKKKGT